MRTRLESDESEDEGKPGGGTLTAAIASSLVVGGKEETHMNAQGRGFRQLEDLFEWTSLQNVNVQENALTSLRGLSSNKQIVDLNAVRHVVFIWLCVGRLSPGSFVSRLFWSVRERPVFLVDEH